MILTCPDCATSYFVDDDRVPPQGRTVKCSSCGNRWRAMPPSDPEPEPEPVPAVEEAPPPEPVSPADDLVIVAAPPKPKPEPKKASRAPLFLGLGVAVALVAATGAAVLFRQAIADAVPATAPLFAAVGLKVDTLGLAIEDVSFKAVLQGGRPALSITGVIRNKNKVSTETPPIRLSLLDKEGVTLAALVAEPLNAKVPPGARRYFAVSFPDPPANAAKLETAFDLTATPTGHAAEAGHAADAAHAPEAVEAKPLPADSPDALTPHEPH